MFKTFITLLLISIAGSSFAQSHNLIPNSACRFVNNKNGVEGYSVCTVCSEDIKKEHDARVAEDKRAAAALAAATKARLEQQRAADRQQRIVNAALNKKQTLSINAPRPGPAAKPVSQSFKDKTTKGGRQMVMYSNLDAGNWRLNRLFLEDARKQFGTIPASYRTFVNDKGDTVLRKNEFMAVAAARKQAESGTFPYNVGLVYLDKYVTASSGRKFDDYCVMDIVNDRGQRLLNDDRVVMIYHVGGDYFLVAQGDEYFYTNQYTNFVETYKAYLYNVKTQEKYQVAVKGLELAKETRIWEMYDRNKWKKGTYKGYVFVKQAGRTNNGGEYYYVTLDDRIVREESK